MGLRVIGGPADYDRWLGGFLEQLDRSADSLLGFGQRFAYVCFRGGPEFLKRVAHRILGACEFLSHRTESCLGYSGAAIPYFDADAGFRCSGALRCRVPAYALGFAPVLTTGRSGWDDCRGAPTWHFASCLFAGKNSPL